MSETSTGEIKYTNHSLRATAASQMFVKNVPEKIIAEKTEHKCLGGLRAYEQTTLDQEQAAASILGSSEVTFNQEPIILKFVCDKSHSFEENAACEQDSVNDKPANDQKKFPVFSGLLQNCTFNFY